MVIPCSKSDRLLCGVQMSLMKNSVLRGGTDLSVDERTFVQYEVRLTVFAIATWSLTNDHPHLFFSAVEQHARRAIAGVYLSSNVCSAQHAA